ncbi:hypothetical protein GS454_20230 [Rhodococcus hoagii]|nr:hypothetical protein [Prescottella equi]
MEHIDAQTRWAGPTGTVAANGFSSTPMKSRVVRDELGHAAAARLVEDIGVALDSAELRRREFEQLEDRVVELLGATDVHTLENLALLSQSREQRLSNALFASKRLACHPRAGSAFIPPRDSERLPEGVQL